MWSVWCRALVGALLMTLGASLEFYDQLPATTDQLYQDDNDIDTGPSAQMHLPSVSDLVMQKLMKALELQKIADERLLNSDLVMQKLMKALELQKIADERLSNRMHLSSREEIERRVEHVPETATLKESVFKRLAEVFGGRAPAHRALDQQRWKIKKGKLPGSNMVCYFKLCAFRSPA